MATVLLILVVVLVLAALVFGVVSLLSGDDPGLGAVEPDGRAVALPNNRSLTETDLKSVRFDVSWRGYRMAQVDRVLRRTAYDIGYKDEMIAVLEAEVQALRDGRGEDADLLRKARESAANPSPGGDNGSAGDSVINLDADWETSDHDLAVSGVSTGADGLSVTMAGKPDFSTDPVAASVDVAGTPSELDDEEARLEAARQEAATPGKIAGRSPHSAKYAARADRSAAKATNGTAGSQTVDDTLIDEPSPDAGAGATPTDNGTPFSPAAASSNSSPDASPNSSPDSSAVGSAVADGADDQSAAEPTDPPADRSARA
jgi:DivIVA domain-containing protein